MDLRVQNSLSTRGQFHVYNDNLSAAPEEETTLRAAFYDNDFAGGWSVFNEGHLDWVGTGSDLSDHLVATGNTSGGAAPVIVEEELTGFAGTFDSLVYGALVADWPAETCEAYHVGTDERPFSTDWYTGNHYEVEQDLTLQSFSEHLVLVDPCDLNFYVHKSTSSIGPWDLVAQVTVASAPDGDQYYDSGLLDIDLAAGEFVALGVVPECFATTHYTWDYDLSPFDELSGFDLGGYMTNIGGGYEASVPVPGVPSGLMNYSTLNWEQMVFLTPDE
jgi:hypothetical protein